MVDLLSLKLNASYLYSLGMEKDPMSFHLIKLLANSMVQSDQGLHYLH